MACVLTASRALDCRDSVGGIKRIYVTELENKNTLSSTNGVIGTFTLDTGKKFWTYDFEKQTGSFEEAIQTSVENGTLFYETTLKIILNKMDVATRNELRLLAQNRLMIIIQDNNGLYWLMGETNGADLAPSKGMSGTAMGDRNGYELNFIAQEPQPMNTVNSSLITTLTAVAV